mmetsp:Transcript_76921/g.168142  ORF Transcript_76921/g.168142 Transcript_76921/m.168142 type:complete len:399 (-) Transcript_76921:211-1407(-)
MTLTLPVAKAGEKEQATPDEAGKGSGHEQDLPQILSKAGRQYSSASRMAELHQKAHAARASFTRPRSWVLLFGWSLAFCAGLVNVVAYRSWGLYVSHMTGDTTAIGLRIEGVHQHDMEFFTLHEAVMILVSFLLGAFLCGMLIDKNQVHFGGKSFYGLALVGNSGLLIVATFVKNPTHAACLAAIACGLQNAMCTSHFGAVVRTTHVTGTATDIGSTLGRITMIFLRNGCRHSSMNIVDRAEVGVDARKLLVLAPMLLCFLLGTMTGAYLFALMDVFALLIPASLTGVVGLCYMLFRQRLKGYLKHIEAERLNMQFESMRGTLERAQTMLHSFKSPHHASKDGDDNVVEDGEVVIELEHGFEDMLERMRTIEEGIEHFRQMPCSTSPVKERASTHQEV